MRIRSHRPDQACSPLTARVIASCIRQKELNNVEIL